FALAYARKGFAVFPCWPVLPSITGGTYICKCGSARCTDQGKHPAGRLVPNGLRDATTVPEQIKHLWRGMPDANIGMTLDRGKSVLTPSSEAWCDLVGTGAGEGHRNVTITRITGHLLRRRVDSFVVLELMLCWNAARCDPPLDSTEVTAIVDSVCGLELKRRA